MKNAIQLLFILVLTVFIGRIMDNGRMMIPEFTTPYFSGSAILNTNFDWNFSPADADSLRRINQIEDDKERIRSLNKFKFNREPDDSRSYSLNQKGYIFIVLVSTWLFPWMGDIAAVKLFQLLIHSLLSFLILIQLKSSRQKLLFFFLYIINPFVVYYAIYPFYYFWQVVPSAIAIILLRRKNYSVGFLYLTAILFALMFHIRSTSILVIIVCLLLFPEHIRRLRRWGAFSIFLVLVWFFYPHTEHKHPGHIMYVSLGAYPNEYVQGFSDTVAWNAYRKHTGKQFDYQSKPGMYDASVFFAESEWCLREYTQIAKEEPLMILRNAALNYFQSFGFGHFRSSLSLSYLSTLCGLIIFSFFIYRKNMKAILLISAASLSYILYLPPLPVYMYGSYLLIIYFLIEEIFS